MITHQMSEVSHHASVLALCHVQCLGIAPQDIKTPVSAHKAVILRNNSH